MAAVVKAYSVEVVMLFDLIPTCRANSAPLILIIERGERVLILGAFSCTQTCYFHAKNVWFDIRSILRRCGDATLHQTTEEGHALFSSTHTPKGNQPDSFLNKG